MTLDKDFERTKPSHTDMKKSKKKRLIRKSKEKMLVFPKKKRAVRIYLQGGQEKRWQNLTTRQGKKEEKGNSWNCGLKNMISNFPNKWLGNGRRNSCSSRNILVSK